MAIKEVTKYTPSGKNFGGDHKDVFISRVMSEPNINDRYQVRDATTGDHYWRANQAQARNLVDVLLKKGHILVAGRLIGRVTSHNRSTARLGNPMKQAA